MRQARFTLFRLTPIVMFITTVAAPRKWCV